MVRYGGVIKAVLGKPRPAFKEDYHGCECGIENCLGHGIEQNISEDVRRRVKVSTSTRGVKTWDCSVEVLGGSIEDVLRESDSLVEELDRRYGNVSEE
mgnify:CR=1 FL=1|tara:strand:- start:68 stop:361 length:294 start_codon:yes stop_codon:yes gene_type:complete